MESNSFSKAIVANNTLGVWIHDVANSPESGNIKDTSVDAELSNWHMFIGLC